MTGEHPTGGDTQVRADLLALGLTVSDAGSGKDPAEATIWLRQALTDGSRGMVAVVDRRFVGHRHSLRLTVGDPRYQASHVPGVLAVSGEARAVLASTLVDEEPPAHPDELAKRLAEAGVEVRDVPLGELVALVPSAGAERDAARRAVAAVDDEAVRLRRSVKSDDGLFTTFFVSTYSRHIARWCARRGMTPNQVTFCSLLLALAGAACAATGQRAGYVFAALLLLASFVLDCVDGQLARYTLNFSRVGSWLDATFDRAKEYAFYVGLAYGSSRDGHDVWALAVCAMALTTVRHHVDFAFHEAERDGAAPARTGTRTRVPVTTWVRRTIVLPIGERWALLAVMTAVATPRTTFEVLLGWSAFAAAYTTAGRVLRSLRHAPERAPAAGTALGEMSDDGLLVGWVTRGPVPLADREVLVTLILGVAAAGQASGGLRRSNWFLWLGLAVYVLMAMNNHSRALTSRLGWLVPPIYRAAEYATVIGAVYATDQRQLPVVYGLLAAVIYHHYDTVYRLRAGAAAPPRWLVMAIGGHESRLLAVVLVTVLVPAASLHLVLTAVACYVALVVLAESVWFWLARSGSARLDEGELA